MLSVQNMKPSMVANGNPVHVFGAGFDSHCSVTVSENGNSSLASVLDYNDSELVFSAPEYIGEYTIMVSRDGVLYASFSLQVVKLEKSDVWKLPARDDKDFRHALIGLLPRGFAWFTGRCGNWWKLFGGFGAGLQSVYNLFCDLAKQMSPMTTSSFAEWENELGLPKKGIVRDSSIGRLEEIYRISRKKGGNTVPYFKSVASLFGRYSEIYEYWKNPEVFEGVDFGEDDPNFYWMVAIESRHDDWHICTCNDTCNDYLQEWWFAPLEAMFDLIKPAHTKLLYKYIDVEHELVVVDDENNVISTPSERPIAAAVRSGSIVNTGEAVLEDGTMVRTIRVKDLPDAGSENAFVLRDSEEGGTTKTRAMTEEEFDELWDDTPAEEEDDG